jgi:hypothetical protein
MIKQALGNARERLDHPRGRLGRERSQMVVQALKLR